jgi:hypothetical protein
MTDQSVSTTDQERAKAEDFGAEAPVLHKHAFEGVTWADRVDRGRHDYQEEEVIEGNAAEWTTAMSALV